jgi:PAS domain S-box-containing protein
MLDRLWDANTAFCTLMGYNRMEITGLSLLNATAPCDADTSSQHWNQILKSTGATNVTYICKLVRKDAQQIQCSIDLSLVFKQGKPQCLLVSANPSV